MALVKILGTFTAPGDTHATGINVNQQPGAMTVSNQDVVFPGSPTPHAVHTAIASQSVNGDQGHAESGLYDGTHKVVVDGVAGSPGSGGFKVLDASGTVVLERGPQAFNPGSGSVTVQA